MHRPFDARPSCPTSSGLGFLGIHLRVATAGAPSTRISVDLSLHVDQFKNAPSADDIRAVQAAGGRVLYTFRVALLRAELDTGAVRALVVGPKAIANVAFAVHDTSKMVAEVQVFSKRRPITERDKADLRRFAVDTLLHMPSDVIEALIPDSLIPRVVALPNVEFVRATPWGCMLER